MMSGSTESGSVAFNFLFVGFRCFAVEVSIALIDAVRLTY